MTLINF